MLLIRKRDFPVILKFTVMTVYLLIIYISPVVSSNNYVRRGGNAMRSMPELFMVLGVSKSVFRCCFLLLFLFFVFVSLLFSLFFSDAAAYLRKDEKTADVGVSVKRIYINSWRSYSHINRCRKGS